MELEILKLIYDYSVNRKIGDQKFIDKLIEIVVRGRNLDSYVREVTFVNTSDSDESGIVCASYGLLTRNISVNYESVKTVLEMQEYYDCLFNSFEQIMSRNLMVAQFILHELEHAYQNKQADSDLDNSIETKLIKAVFTVEQAIKNPGLWSKLLEARINPKEFVVYIRQRRELYKQYYILDPSERFAQVNSFSTLEKSLKEIKDYIPSLYEFICASLLEEELRGFEESWNDGICPTQVYLSKIRQDKIWSEFDFYSKDAKKLIENVSGQYPLVRRLTLGLPVSISEYTNIDNMLRATNKYNI